ncbi:MAG: prolipoprotein diacylglyceryl transferase [Patescibacteria group bacterium]|jgi:phosphatidylglycerol:prolipoprotein diacylglycerol transferase
MLPNLHWSTIPLSLINIQVWGLFVALGILAAALVAKRSAAQWKISGETMIDLTFWVVLAAFIGSRLFYVITEWQYFTSNFVEIFKIWDGGMSISGGFLGAIITAVIYLRKKKLPFWPYADLAAFVLPLGLAIGRLGCFFIFDHPGSVTNFFLGEVYYGDGLVRHNHGLYLAISGAGLFGVFTLIKHFCRDALQCVSTKTKPPFFVGLFLIWDGLVRVMLDFDRILDSRWFGLTAAQYIGVVSVLCGFYLTFRKK